MNTNKLIILLGIAPVSLIILLTLIRAILRKLTPAGESDLRLKPAYGLYFSSLLIAGIIDLLPAIAHTAEAADNLSRAYTHGALGEMAKSGILFTGLSLTWFLLSFLLSTAFATVFTGIRKDSEEMALGNTYYFLIKGILLGSISLLMAPALTLVLRWFMPAAPQLFIH